MRSFSLSLLTLALLLPAMWRRHERRNAARDGRPVRRRRQFAVVAVTAALLAGSVGGAAFASDGDRSGADTTLSSESVVPADTPPDQVTNVLTAAIAKDRVEKSAGERGRVESHLRADLAAAQAAAQRAESARQAP